MFQLTRWGPFLQLLVKYGREIPLNDLVWYPGCRMITNKCIFNVLSVIPLVLPAYIIDTFLRFRGRKPT